MSKTILAISGGGFAAAATAAAVEMHTNLKPDIIVGCSGGAFYAGLRQYKTPQECLDFLTSFKKTDDAYKLNLVLRLFGWFFQANGLYNYKPLKKRMSKELTILKHDVDVFCQVYKLVNRRMELGDADHATMIEAISIPMFIELESRYCDAGLIDVLPLYAIERLAKQGDKVVLVDFLHPLPKPVDPKGKTWRDMIKVLTAYSAHNTAKNDLIAIREHCAKNGISLVEHVHEYHTDIMDFSSDNVKAAYEFARGKV